MNLLRLMCVLGLLALMPILAGAESMDDATPLNLVSEVEKIEEEPPPGLMGSFAMMVFSLSLVLSLIGSVYWLAKKYLPVQKIPIEHYSGLSSYSLFLNQTHFPYKKTIP